MSAVKTRLPFKPDCKCASHLESLIRRELCAVAYPSFRHLGCVVRDGVLVLSGRLPSYYLKQVAQTIVRPLLEPAMVIDNQISVDRHDGHLPKVRQ